MDDPGYPAGVRSCPGLVPDSVEYKVCNGDSVYTAGKVSCSDGYEWYQPDDGGWIAGSLIGY